MKLERFFQRRGNVEVAYLFGSASRGSASHLSDIDIGVYLSDSLEKESRNRERLELIAGLTSLLKSDRVDLVVMNDASIAINFEIIKANRPIFVRSRDKKLDFEHRVMSRYLDRKCHEKELNREFIESAKERGFA